jgi:hypothetical protein
MELFRSQFRRPRFSLIEMAAAVVTVAVAFKWPVLLLPTSAVVLLLFLDRCGFSLVLALAVISALGAALGYVMGRLAL